VNSELSLKYDNLIQLDWADVGRFMFRRFHGFPEKLPSGLIHHQWPSFAKEYSHWFHKRAWVEPTEADSVNAIGDYVESGRFPPRGMKP